MPETKAAASPSAMAEAVPSDLDEKIERWFADHFPNSVVSRSGSEVWNLVHAAKEDLKKRLAKVI